jgi:hypothetical protein
MTAEFLSASTADFVPDSNDSIISLWLHAVQQQRAAEGGLWDGAWRAAADAWAQLARACPESHRQDIAVFWGLSGDAARAAKKASRGW